MQQQISWQLWLDWILNLQFCFYRIYKSWFAEKSAWTSRSCDAQKHAHWSHFYTQRASLKRSQYILYTYLPVTWISYTSRKVQLEIYQLDLLKFSYFRNILSKISKNRWGKCHFLFFNGIVFWIRNYWCLKNNMISTGIDVFVKNDEIWSFCQSFLCDLFLSN